MKIILKTIALTGLFILSLNGLTKAQVAEKKSLTLDGARQVIAAAKDYARKNNAPGGVIAVVDEGGNLVALERSGRNIFGGREYFHRQSEDGGNVQTPDQSF